MAKRFELKLNPILSGQNEYLKSQLFLPPDPVFDKYSREYLPCGLIRDYYNPEKDKKKIFALDISQAFRMLFVAKTRTGKSWFLRGINDRARECGMAPVYITDVKNEYGTSNRPVQSKFYDKLIKNEKPKQAKMKTFRPTFFQFLEGDAQKLPDSQQWCSMDISKYTPRDLQTVLRFLGITDLQMMGIERMLFEARQDRIIIKDLDDLRQMIEQADYIENKSSILNKLYKITYYNPFDVKYRMRPHIYVREGYTLSLNLQYFDSLEKNNGFLQTVVTSWMRDLINARKRQEIPPLILNIDETPRFCPANGDSTARYEILESTDTDTAYDVSYIFASQDIVSIPERLVKQCRYIFCPWNVDYQVLKDAFKAANLAAAEVKSQQYNELRRITSRMEQWDWLAIDLNEKIYTPITPLAPLTHAKETE